MPRSRSRRRRRDREVDRLPPQSPLPERRRRRKHRAECSPSEGREGSESNPADEAQTRDSQGGSGRDSRWVCGTCGGPHRSKECPMSANPLGVMGGMMGGMMPMGMPGMMGMPPAESDKKSKRKRHKTRKEESSEDNSDAASNGSRGRGKRRAQERIEEAEKFIEANRINDEAATKIRALSPDSQRRLVARPLTGDVQNPSKVMIARVRELQSQNERLKGNGMWNAWNSAMMGASPEAVKKYIDDNDLDESASRQMRSLPPHLQAHALRFDISSFRNPSAKFMSLASGLSNPARMPMPGMGGMPGMAMPGMPFGWPMGAPPGMAPMAMTPSRAALDAVLDDDI